MLKTGGDEPRTLNFLRSLSNDRVARGVQPLQLMDKTGGDKEANKTMVETKMITEKGASIAMSGLWIMTTLFLQFDRFYWICVGTTGADCRQRLTSNTRLLLYNVPGPADRSTVAFAYLMQFFLNN